MHVFDIRRCQHQALQAFSAIRKRRAQAMRAIALANRRHQFHRDIASRDKRHRYAIVNFRLGGVSFKQRRVGALCRLNVIHSDDDVIKAGDHYGTGITLIGTLQS